ncbi:MAG: hypothetical protein GXO86_02085 [Chlorobi bacterium]|nr:hypothetical protein [Chlorobiota bacterium]
MIIDRKDDTINLCEIKYYNASFTIDKSFARRLVERRQRFIEFTQTRKQVFNTIISNHGVSRNKYSLEVMDSEVKLEALMQK